MATGRSNLHSIVGSTVMRQPTALLCVWGASLVACGSDLMPPSFNPSRCITSCDGGVPFGGGGGGGRPSLDAGGGSSGGGTLDATVDVPAPTSVTGRLRVFRDLPPRNDFIPSAGGWTIRTLPPLDADARTFTELSAVTDNTGAFTLPGLPLRQVLPGESATGYWLLATAPAAGRIASLFTVRETGAITLDTVTDDTVRAVINSAGLIQADDRAMVAVLVRQSTVPGALPVRNVRVQADGQVSATLYDGIDGVEIAKTGTGPLGFALLPNVPVPAGNEGVAAVTVDRAPRPYVVRVRRGALSWMLAVSN